MLFMLFCSDWINVAIKQHFFFHQDFFSLEDLHLPPIESAPRKPADRSHTKGLLEEQGPLYENKPFKLPTVLRTPNIPVSKTYSTKRGALLLYSERYVLPGSPKLRKRRRKYKKQQQVKLKTIGDLRDLVLGYHKNGVSSFHNIHYSTHSHTYTDNVSCVDMSVSV